MTKSRTFFGIIFQFAEEVNKSSCMNKMSNDVRALLRGLYSFALFIYF